MKFRLRSVSAPSHMIEAGHMALNPDWCLPHAAVDGKAHARTVGGDKFTIHMEGPFQAGATPAVIKDNSNGTYLVTWTTNTVGDYLLTAKLDGYPVGGCPACCTGG